MIVINYYECNKDSIWTVCIVICIMCIFTVGLKLFVYNEMYNKLNICSPFSYFTGDRRKCVQTMQSFVQETETEPFETMDSIEYMNQFVSTIQITPHTIYLGMMRILLELQLYYDKITEIRKYIQTILETHFIRPVAYKVLTPITKKLYTIFQII